MMIRSLLIVMAVFILGLAAGAMGATPASPPTRNPNVSPRHLALPLFLTKPISNQTPNADQLRRGQYLVRVGDCAPCHTPEGGPPFAGSFGLNTPFGVIYSTNLTSDPETGIGALSADKFYAALHEGIGPKGLPIYPAMPYTAFTRVSRADSDAMLAYLKTVPAVHRPRPANRLPFPLNLRFMMRGWNLLFFSSGNYQPHPGKSADWNRGAYIVNGLGHCGSCHTPKNFLGADKSSKPFQGGNLNEWFAPELTANARTGLGAWSVDDIVEYLKTGRNGRVNAGGPMADVVTNSTALMSDQDLRAIAVYLKDQPAGPSGDVRDADLGAMRRGKAIYSDACASCHMLEGGGQSRTFPPIAGNAMLQQGDPAGLIHLILAGGRSAPTPTRPTALSMPSFAWKLTDQQIADVSTFIRNDWGNRAEPVNASAVAVLRKRLGLDVIRRTDNSGDGP
jgi:mono/diheme cytochrome c family protein